MSPIDLRKRVDNPLQLIIIVLAVLSAYQRLILLELFSFLAFGPGRLEEQGVVVDEVVEGVLRCASEISS